MPFSAMPSRRRMDEIAARAGADITDTRRRGVITDPASTCVAILLGAVAGAVLFPALADDLDVGGALFMGWAMSSAGVTAYSVVLAALGNGWRCVLAVAATGAASCVTCAFCWLMAIGIALGGG